MKVYLIWSGQYSGKEVDFVTADKDKAEKLLEIAKKNDWSHTAWIDERDTNEGSGYLFDEDGLHLYVITFSHNSCSIENWDDIIDVEEDVDETTDGLGIIVYVHAKDEEEALKIAAERRAEYLAEKEGLT